MPRPAIFHYHLFKNAGTSLDRILKRNFGDRWVTREFGGHDNTAPVEKWIQDTPEAVAYSTHTAMGPIPQVEGVRITTIMLLRDPIERIRSAYRFERNQEADTLGANLAKKTDFEGYVRGRLAIAGDRQCRNFQTQRLASLVPGPEPELARAREAMKRLTVVGAVKDFDGTVARLAAAIGEDFPDFTWDPVRANVSERGAMPETEELTELLTAANRDDLALLQEVGRE